MSWKKTSLIKFMNDIGCPDFANGLPGYQKERAILLGEFLDITEEEIHEENIEYKYIGGWEYEQRLYVVKNVEEKEIVLVSAVFDCCGCFYFNIGKIQWENFTDCIDPH